MARRPNTPMADRTSAPQRQEARPQGVIARLVTLPFHAFGALCGSLLLSILIEWLGMHFLWPHSSWHHAQGMLRYELHQISMSFPESLMLSHPAETARWLVTSLHERLAHHPHLAAWVANARTRPLARLPHLHTLTQSFSVAEEHLKPYLLASVYTTLTFLARLIVLALTLPLFLLTAFVGFVDGLVRRDLRRFGAGHESGFVYHRARAAVAPAAILPWVVYLALPVSVAPLAILLPGAVLLGLAVNVTAANFKKYL